MSSRITVLLALLIAPVLASAQPLADHVPSDAIIYVGWRGSADLGPGYAGSNLKALLDDSQMSQFIDEFLPAVLDKLGRENAQAGEIGRIVATIARPSWQHPTAFFFAGIEQPNNGPPVPHLGLIWKPGADADALAQQLDQLIGQVQPPFPVKVVHKGDLVAVMVGYDNPEAALADGKGLAGDAIFTRAMSRLIKDPAAAVYVDYEKLLNMFRPLMASGDPNAAATFESVWKATGFQDLKRAAVTSGFDGNDWGTQAFVEAPAPRTGFLKLMSDKPIADGFLAAIPMDVTLAAAGRLNLSGVLDTLRKVAQAADPNVGRQLDQCLDQVSRRSGVDIQKDLLDSLGDEWACFIDPAIGGRGLAGITAVNRLKDAARFEQSLSKIEDFALKQIEQQIPSSGQLHLSFQTIKSSGLTIHYLAVPLVSPSWVVSDGRLYVSAYPQVAAAAARHGAGKGPSILDNPGFTALRKRLGRENPTSFTFMDLPKTAPDAYGLWLVINRVPGFADLFGLKSPPMLLLELSKLQAHLSPAGSVSWVDQEGFHMRSVEPFPGSKMIASDPAITALYAEPVAAAIILPALQKARAQAAEAATRAREQPRQR